MAVPGELKKAISEALESGKAAAAVVLSEKDGELVPNVITRPDDRALDNLHAGDRRYPMASFAIMLLPGIEGGLAVPVRECDRRMLVELTKYNQVDADRLILLGIPCSQALADGCGCDHPFVPDDLAVALAVARPVEPSPLAEASSEDPAERLSFWMESFSKCIKCMGCRNVCPMCFCKECALDNPDLVSKASEPDIPIFHLIRAADMADRCVDCGMCEEICPADIPLRQLYRFATGAVREAFGYEPGVDPDDKSPLDMLGTPSSLGGMQEGFRK
jgi:formate dehydrogenase subunit beta